MSNNQRPPYLGPLTLAHDSGIDAISSSPFGDGGLFRKSTIDAAVDANTLCVIDTEGASSMIVRCVMRDIVSSGSGTSKTMINFFGLIPSGENGESDSLDNPWLMSRTELYRLTPASGNVTGTSSSPPVVSPSGHEFFSHHDWDTGAVSTGRIWILNSRLDGNGDPNKTASTAAISEVASTDDEGYFCFINSVGAFNKFAFDYEKGSLSAAKLNLYYSLIYH